jgi:hypothetical protein
MRFRAILFAFFIALLSLLPASAQIPANKLFAYSNGDIWTWFTGGNPEQITTWGYNGGPIISPDERYIAYLSIATEAVEEINASQAYPFMGTPPSNLWIMDTATLLAERVAVQDSYPTLRGIPAWSPSGRELAWIEFDQNAQTNNTRLVVYDLDTRQSRVLASNLSLGFQDAGYYIPSVQWGAAISRLLFTFAEDGHLLFIMETYDPETGAMSQYLLSFEGDMSVITDNVPIDYVWVTHQGISMMAILTRAGEWYLLDSRDGSQHTLSRGPALTNDSGVSISPIFTKVGDSWEIHWRANDGTIAADLPFVNYSISQNTPSLSPDGSAVAWNNNGDLSYLTLSPIATTSILDSAETSAFVQPANIAWSAMQWLTKSETTPRATPIAGDGNACNNPSRLQIGDIVTVRAGLPNNIRAEANLSSAIVAEFAPGEVARVADGPVCVDNYRWWYVVSEEIQGWTAEGNATEYWLEASPD